MILQLLLVAIGLSYGFTGNFEESTKVKVLDKIHWGLALLFTMAASVANAQRHHEPSYEVANSYHLPSFGDFFIEFLKSLPFVLAGAVVGFGIKFLWRKLHTDANNKGQQGKEKRNVSATRQSPAGDVKPQVDGIQTTNRGPINSYQTSKRTPPKEQTDYNTRNSGGGSSPITERGISVIRRSDGTYSSEAKPEADAPPTRPATFTEGGIKVTRHPDGTYSSEAKPPSVPPS